jgi:O-antigen/teichoic acid export membrane protein
LNTAWTGVANVWAMVLALVTLPLLLAGLGPVAFGTWALLQTFSAITGWLSVVDVGVGTAATKAIAERASVDDERGVATSIASALACFGTLGMACAAALALVGPSVLPHLFNTPPRLVGDLRFALVPFAIQVVVELVIEGVEACLEGLQRVDLSRAVDGLRRTAVAGAMSAVALAGGGLRGVAVASSVASGAGLVAAVA